MFKNSKKRKIPLWIGNPEKIIRLPVKKYIHPNSAQEKIRNDLLFVFFTISEQFPPSIRQVVLRKVFSGLYSEYKRKRLNPKPTNFSKNKMDIKGDWKKYIE